MTHHTRSLSTVAVLAGLGAAVMTFSSSRPAEAQPAISGELIAGIDQDASVIGRLLAGGIWELNRFAPELHLGFDGFLRIDSANGTAARSITLIDVGARYAFMADHFVGPYVSLGGSFGLFTGSPRERKVADDPEVCATAGNPESCAFIIDRNLNARLGVGWGFRSSDNTTVAVRVDLTYWAFSVAPGQDQPGGAPIAREVPRPVDSWSLLIGFEFMRWQ